MSGSGSPSIDLKRKEKRVKKVMNINKSRKKRKKKEKREKRKKKRIQKLRRTQTTSKKSISKTELYASQQSEKTIKSGQSTKQPPDGSGETSLKNSRKPSPSFKTWTKTIF